MIKKYNKNKRSVYYYIEDKTIIKLPFQFNSLTSIEQLIFISLTEQAKNASEIQRNIDDIASKHVKTTNLKKDNYTRDTIVRRLNDLCAVGWIQKRKSGCFVNYFIPDDVLSELKQRCKVSQ